MAKSRKINNALIRVFDQSTSIVYLISDELKVSYANEACAVWLGMDLESLVGTNLIFSSETLEDQNENAAKGLAIAPDLIAKSEEIISLPLKIFSNTGGSSGTRNAIANAIYDHRGVLSGYLVIGETKNMLPNEDVRSSLDQPAKLHEALAIVRQKQKQRFNTSRLVGTSATADRVRRQVKSATKSDGDVLVVGPTGSGREHVARTVFSSSAPVEKSNVSDARLVPLHCSITDPVQIQQTMKELLEPSEGRATLLLIDVDRLDAGSQQELLGYLQLPGNPPRMIATASRPLLDPAFAFDQNLASRLSTITIELSPLADRLEDLPLLAQAILESKNEQSARQLSGFTRQAIEMICEYDWPGNFGQLASAIDEAAANADGPVIKVADFSENFQHTIKAQQFAAKAETKIQLNQYLLDIEQQLVQRAVVEAKGNKTKAAELLGISRAKLLRRLATFEQPEPEELDELLDPSVFEEAVSDEDN